MPLPSQRDLPNLGTEPRSPELQTDSLLSELQGSPLSLLAAAVAAKSLQSCLTLCDPIDGSPPGSPVPGILQARETWVRSLGWEDPLEKGKATYSSILAWRIPWTIWGRKELDTTERLHFHFSLSCIGEGNGNPFQCSCLENPRDVGAWWAAV